MAILSQGGENEDGGGEQATAPPVERVRTNLPPKTGPIVGRKAEMQAVANAFNRLQQQQLPGRVEIVGREGIGASSVAIELARRVGPQFPGGAWYLPLELGADLAWAEIGLALGKGAVGNLAEYAEAARSELASGPRALLVVDGAKSAADLDAALPSDAENLDVFVVSHEATGAVDQVVEVGEVPPHGARRIAHTIVRAVHGPDREAPTVRSLDGLGVTAGLAGRAAAAYDGGMGALSFKDTFEALNRMVPLIAQNGLSIELLLVASVVHPIRIPMDGLFHAVAALRAGGGGEIPTGQQIGNAVLPLVRLGVLVPEDDRRVSMHPMVQAAAQQMTQREEDLAVARNAALRGFLSQAEESLTDEGVDLSRSVVQHLRHLRASLEGEPLEACDAMLARLNAALGIDG